MALHLPATAKKYAVSYIFLAVLFALAAGAFFQLKKIEWGQYHYSWKATLRGDITRDIEKHYEREFLLKEYVMGIWGAISYSLFNTGNKGVVIGSEGWLYTAEEFEVAENFEKSVENNLRYIRTVNTLLQKQGIALIVVLVPAKSRIYPEHLDRITMPEKRKRLYEHIRNALPSEIFLNGYAVLRKYKKTGPLFFRTDTHWSPLGAKLMARAVAAHIKNYQPDLALHRTNFFSHPEAVELYEGDLSRFIATGKFRPIFGPEKEPLIAWRTQAVNTSLFADNPIPAALLGTSYSAMEEWNFVGFLQQELQADVLNLAEEGEGPIAPMQKFLASQKWKDTPLKLVIWEFPERFLPVQYTTTKQGR